MTGDSTLIFEIVCAIAFKIENRPGEYSIKSGGSGSNDHVTVGSRRFNHRGRVPRVVGIPESSGWECRLDTPTLRNLQVAVA